MSTWIVGEFPSVESLADAGRKLREKGFNELDAYSPYPLHGIEEALGLPRSKVSLVAGTGAIMGLVAGYGLQWFLNVMEYPINVAGRPLHSPPANIPVTFELTILLTALSIFGSLIFYFFRFPRPHHPVFEVPGFESASTHGYWMSIHLKGAEKREDAKTAFSSLGAQNIAVVEEEA
jgi:hypothetical protein